MLMAAYILVLKTVSPKEFNIIYNTPGTPFKFFAKPEKWWTIGFYILLSGQFLIFNLWDLILFLPAVVMLCFYFL